MGRIFINRLQAYQGFTISSLWHLLDVVCLWQPDAKTSRDHLIDLGHSGLIPGFIGIKVNRSIGYSRGCPICRQLPHMVENVERKFNAQLLALQKATDDRKKKTRLNRIARLIPLPDDEEYEPVRVRHSGRTTRLRPGQSCSLR